MLINHKSINFLLFLLMLSLLSLISLVFISRSVKIIIRFTYIFDTESCASDNRELVREDYEDYSCNSKLL